MEIELLLGACLWLNICKSQKIRNSLYKKYLHTIGPYMIMYSTHIQYKLYLTGP